MSVPQIDVPKVLIRVHAKVRKELARCGEDGEQPVRRNAKGDVQYPFDLAADTAVRRCLEEEFGSGIVLSEELGHYRFGEGEAAYRFVIDPVDGSDNYKRGLPLSAIAVAVLPTDGAIAIDRVLWSLVGGLETDLPIIATRGQGAFQGDCRLRVSNVQSIADAVVSCELNHHAPSARFAKLLGSLRGVRTYGCASRAMAFVARGALDAHLDFRDRLTPESFLASALALEEAGGCIVGLDGQPLRDLTGLTDRTSLVAAATPQLAQEILDAISSDD